MILAPFSRRSLIGAAALLGPLLRTGAAMPADPLLVAVRLTEVADAAHRAAGLASKAHAAGGRLSTEWRAKREATARARFEARANLHSLTPTTAGGARALVSYYAARAERVGTRGAARAARRRLREVFARSGAFVLDRASWGFLSTPDPVPPLDPVFAAIQSAAAAEDRFRATLAALPDEPGDEESDAAEQVGFASDQCRTVLMSTRPTTFAGLCALVRHLGDEAQRNKTDDGGATLLRLAELLDAGPPIR